MKRQYVGIDLHRRSTTVYRMNEDGELLGCRRIPSQPFELAQAIAEAGPEPKVVLERAGASSTIAVVSATLGATGLPD